MGKNRSGMISIIIPTYNEKDNLPKLVDQIFAALGAVPGEVVVVDDASPDGTGEVAESLKARHPVQVVHRKGKLGLASAVLEGFSVAKGDRLCVMDADLSHDPALLPKMAEALDGEAELVIGSRYVKGGGSEGWPLYREMGSRFAILLARPITPVRDATSGYFCFNRSIIDGVMLDPLGFKIGLEIFVKGNYKKAKELPFVFHDRLAGQSKLSKKEILNYLKHLVKLYKWRLRGASRQSKRRS